MEKPVQKIDIHFVQGYHEILVVGEMQRNFIKVPDFRKSENDSIDVEVKKLAVLQRDISQKQLELEVDEEFEGKIREEEAFSGQFFKKVRRYKNMLLDYVSSKTKISLYYLDGMEREDFSILPPRIYVRGFIQSYSKLLDLDVQKATSAYMERYDKASK